MDPIDNGDAQRVVLTSALYSERKRNDTCHFSELSFDAEDRTFEQVPARDGRVLLKHESGAVFSVTEIKPASGKQKGKYRALGNARRVDCEPCEPGENFNLNGEGETGLRLRSAQIGSVHALLSHWSLSPGVATVVLPTGTGKTETMLATTLADGAKRTLVIVPTIELKTQIADKFANWGMLRSLGVIAPHAKNPAVLVMDATLNNDETLDWMRESRVVVTTPALLARAEEKYLDQAVQLFDHVYFDEAHHVVASEWDDLKKRFSGAKIVQFTATPYRNDRQPIEGKIVYNYPLAKAIDDKCFSEISLVSVEEIHPKKKDKAIADAAMQRLKDDRANGFKRHKMMVRAPRKSAAVYLHKMYKEWFPSESIALVHSNTPNRKAVIEDIKRGKYDIVVCVGMLKEGFDYPDFKIAAVHGVHKSLSVLLQFIGRFTRPQDGLGSASFVVNFADEKISNELEELFQEGVGWEKVISEIADARKAEAESLLTFLQGCEPYSGFDSPDIMLNPRLVFPALSCVCFRASKVDWSGFKEAFRLDRYALSQPYHNAVENVFYFTTQKREKVKWSPSKEVRDQTWNLIALHHDPETELLYVGYSEKRLDVDALVREITKREPDRIDGDPVFRSFDQIKRLSIVHAGVFKPSNHLHRYSRLSGADVSSELSRWKEGNRCKKSDFVGVGFRDGHPVSVGASVKGKVWSPARRESLKEWKAWCMEMGKLLTDETINSNQLLEDSAEKKELKAYPEDLTVLATDWSEQLYANIDMLTLERPGQNPVLLAECSLTFLNAKANLAELKLVTPTGETVFGIRLGGEQGHAVTGLDDERTSVEGYKANPVPLKQFFEEQPPTLFLLNGCTIAGCIHTDYGEDLAAQIPHDRLSVLDWVDVDFTLESMYKHGVKRDASIQEYMMRTLTERGARVVFNDDNSGEVSDVIGIFVNGELIRFELVHCKYSKSRVGQRISDLHEVCGQAIVSLRHKWKPEALLKHMLRRNATGVLAGKRFYTGSEAEIAEISKEIKYKNVTFEFAIAQPGVAATNLSSDQKNFLGSIYSIVMEMTETPLLCYFSDTT